MVVQKKDDSLPGKANSGKMAQNTQKRHKITEIFHFIFTLFISPLQKQANLAILQTYVFHIKV